MLYMPDERWLHRFQVLTWPLPKNLLPALFNRGLAIYLLPFNRSLAEEILYKRLRYEEDQVFNEETDKRKLIDTAHFCFIRKALVMPAKAFFKPGENVLIHEIGHAVDLFFGLLSHKQEWIEALAASDPLSNYCVWKDRERGFPIEQFAYSFQAYFEEDKENYPTVYNLNDKLISMIREKMMIFEGHENTRS